MHKDLEAAFHRITGILEQDPRCKGGWHYGSLTRGQEDIYSDYDPVFLVADKDFEAFAADAPAVLAQAADELLIFWAEDFNSGRFKNFCSVIRLGEELHQLDLFIINADYPDEWMCRQHCKDCTVDHIIFDRTGEVAEFLSRGYRTEHVVPDTVRAMDTFWFHTEMLIKYFKRKDLFKLLKNISVLFHAHVDLLLSHYDTTDWGGWESKVKHSVPPEKQEHLKLYYVPSELGELEAAVTRAIAAFTEDAEEICRAKGIAYPASVSRQITAYFHKRMNESGWE